jgi:hypothetical protein
METSLTVISSPLVPGLSAPAGEPCSLIPDPCSLSLRPVRIIENINPFRTDRRILVELAPFDNESVGAIVARANLRDNSGDSIRFDAFIFSLNGERLADDEIWSTAVRPGWEIILFPKAAGGKIWEMVSMLALTVLCGLITAGAGGIGPLAAFLGPLLTSGQAALIAGTLGVAGSLLISWAFSPGQPSQAAFSSTYDPTGPKGLAQPGVPVPKGYGVMGWCGNVVSSYVSYAGEKAYVNVLVCYGWGQAVGISDVLINLKPISTFIDCSYQTRLGSNTQGPIDGFDKTVNGYPQEIDLLVANGPVIVPGTGTNIQGLEITVKFPAGLYCITADGNDVPMHFIYRIRVAPHGTIAWVSPLFPNPAMTQTAATINPNGTETWPAWVVIPTDRFAGSGLVYATDNGSHNPGDAWSSTETVNIVNIDGSTSTTSVTFQGVWEPCDPDTNPALCTGWFEGYIDVAADTVSALFDTQSVYGLAPGQWDVEVTKIGYFQDQKPIVYADATDPQHVSDGWLWNVNEIFWSNLTYPNMVLIGVQALATSQMSGEDIQVMATITHDIGADTAIPSQLSVYEHDNPAIVAYDILANPLYGMGVAASLIDVPAFIAWANFCDELVTNQDGTQARRFVFAGVFDQAGDAWKVLSVLGAMCRASIIQIGMRYSVVLDAPADPVQLFTVGNTKKDSFTESWLALDDRCTLIECDFADAARTYRMDLPVSVMTAADINSGLQPKITRTKVTGCTSRDQAWRWAYFHLMSTKLSLRTVQLSAPIEACCCQIGSVIALQSDVVQWGVGGRVQQGSTLNTVNVERTDLSFAAAAGWTVSVQQPVVLRGSATVASVSGNVVTMTAPLPAGRITKLVSPVTSLTGVTTAVEYIVTGYTGSAVTLSVPAAPLGYGYTVPHTTTVIPLTVQLYDVNVIDNLGVTAVVVTPPGPNGPGGSVISVSGNFSAVPTPDSAWAYGQSAGYQPAKLFRVVSIKKSGDFNFDIGALEYNAEIYEDVVPSYGEIVGVPNSAPSIANLTLTEQYQNGILTGSPTSALIAVGWQNGNTAVGAQVQVMASTGGTWNTIGNIQGQGCSFVGTIGVTYQVRVTGFDWQGNLAGTPITASITVVASANAPGNVTGFTGVPSSASSILTWNTAAGADHYEIRWAAQVPPATWLTSAVLWDGPGNTWTDTTLRGGIYMIVAVSSASTGSIESVVPAFWTSTANPTVPIAVSSGTLSISAPTYTPPGLSEGILNVASPAGTVTVAGGTMAAIPSQTWTSLFTPGMSGSYYAYIVIDASLTMTGTFMGPLSGSGPNDSSVAADIAAGDLVFLAIWTFESGGGTTVAFVGASMSLV